MSDRLQTDSSKFQTVRVPIIHCDDSGDDSGNDDDTVLPIRQDSKEVVVEVGENDDIIDLLAEDINDTDMVVPDITEPDADDLDFIDTRPVDEIGTVETDNESDDGNGNDDDDDDDSDDSDDDSDGDIVEKIRKEHPAAVDTDGNVNWDMLDKNKDEKESEDSGEKVPSEDEKELSEDEQESEGDDEQESEDGDEPPAKRRRRNRPGTVALREIRQQQMKCDLIIAKLPFQRLIRETAQDFRNELRFTPDALEAIQEASEIYLINIFQGTQSAAIHAGREEIQPKDMQFVKNIRNDKNEGY
jgi:histone H3